MKTVTSRDNAAFKALSRLAASAAERKSRGLSLLEGVRLVEAYLDSGERPDTLVVNPEAMADPRIAHVLDRAAPAAVTVLAEPLFRAISTVESPTGIIAAVRTPRGEPVPPAAELVLALENIQDPGNVGTLLRSAAAAGARHVVLSPTCAFAWSPKVLRSAMGAHFALNILEGADLVELLGRFAGQSVALSASAEASIYELDLARPTAFLIGNEGAGLTGPLQARASVRAHIPMPGRTESLNAATAGAICLFEAVRQRERRA